MTATRERPLRADAARNRDAVLAAAAEVFAQSGVAASVPDIAARAGVGKATVYRSFPTKEALIAAVLNRRLDVIREAADQAAAAPDPGAAFTDLVMQTAQWQAGDHGLTDALALTNHLPELAAPLRAMRCSLDALVARAQDQGTVRADVSGEEVRRLMGGVSRVLADAGEHDPEVWRRYLGLVLDGLAAAPAHG